MTLLPNFKSAITQNIGWPWEIVRDGLAPDPYYAATVSAKDRTRITNRQTTTLYMQKNNAYKTANKDNNTTEKILMFTNLQFNKQISIY